MNSIHPLLGSLLAADEAARENDTGHGKVCGEKRGYNHSVRMKLPCSPFHTQVFCFCHSLGVNWVIFRQLT